MKVRIEGRIDVPDGSARQELVDRIKKALSEFFDEDSVEVEFAPGASEVAKRWLEKPEILKDLADSLDEEGKDW